MGCAIYDSNRNLSKASLASSIRQEMRKIPFDSRFVPGRTELIYDFYDNIAAGKWYYNDNDNTLTVGTAGALDAGVWTGVPSLENHQLNPPKTIAVLTGNQWVKNVQGAFLSLKIPKEGNPTFRSDIANVGYSPSGSLQNFRVWVICDGKEYSWSFDKTTNGEIETIEIDLSDFAGRTVNIYLYNHKGSSPGGAWINPQLINRLP